VCTLIGHFIDRNKGPTIFSEAAFNKVQFENQDTAKKMPEFLFEDYLVNSSVAKSFSIHIRVFSINIF